MESKKAINSPAKPTTQKDSRRAVIKNFCCGFYGALISASLFSRPITASELQQDENHMPIEALIDSLRATGKAVCLEEADRLAGDLSHKVATPQNFHLHLRNANLVEADAKTLARGLQSLSAHSISEMHSFSASFNPTLQQAGIVTLVNSLPQSVTEVGMVGCNMDDKSGRTLLEWASRATALKVICIENNNLSDEVKNGFTALRQHKRDLLVIV